MKSIFKPLNFSFYKEPTSTLSSVCPWNIMCDDGIVLEKGNALTCAYEFIAPDLGSSSASKINNVSIMFNSAITQLGQGWAVQFELQRSYSNEYPYSEIKNLAGYLVERQREINFSYTKAHFANRYFLIFTYQLPSEIESKGTSSFFKSGSGSKPSSHDATDNDIKNFKVVTAKTVAILQTAMYVMRLDSEQLFTLLHSSVSMDWGKRKLPEDYGIFLDRIATDSDLETSMPMKLGDYYIPITRINVFPSESFPAVFDALNKSQCPLRWSTRFICYDKEQAMKRCNDASKHFHGARKSIGQLVAENTMHLESDRIDSAAVAEEGDAEQAKVELTMGNFGYGDYCSNIMVFDKDLERAEDNAKYVSSIVTACGFSAKEETVNALQAFLSMQPGNIFANNFSLFVSSGNLSHVIPISSIWAGLQNNGFMEDICGQGHPHVVCSTEFGIPYYLNLNVKDVGHTWISGPTGAGKSTLLSLLEVQWLKYPKSKVIIFDKDKSARNLTMCVGGNYLEPCKDSTSFQPLADLDINNPSTISWAQNFIEILLAEQKINVTSGMRKAIYQTLKLLASKRPEARSMTSFQQYIESAYQDPLTKTNEIYDASSSYVLGGQYGNIFDSTAANISLSDWTMIEMGSLMEQSSGAVAPALFYLFKECEKKFDGSPVLLVLDEAWVFLKNPIFAAKIVDWLKTLRKKNVFVVFATQEVNDAASSPIASTIISQCASKIYLADEDAETELLYDAYKKFGLEDSEIHLLASPDRMQKKRDYFYKSSLGTRQFQLSLDELQLAILTCSVEDHALLDRLEMKYGRNSGRPLVEEILRAKGVEYEYLMDAA